MSKHTSWHLLPHEQREAAVRAWARQRMSAWRFEHTQGVAQTAEALALRHTPAHVWQLRIAAWIHDAAKELPDSELLRLANYYGYPVREVEYQAPYLLHGVVAALEARAQFQLDDPVIFSAAAYHTTGHPAMQQTDKVLFVADLIEPGRQYKWAEKARQVSASYSLDETLLFTLVKQLRRLIKRDGPVDPRGLALRNHLVASGVQLVKAN